MLPSLRALVFPIAQCFTSSAQNCKRLRSYIQHNCALPDADDLALRAQNFKIADLPMPHISISSTKTSILCSNSPKTRVPKAKKAQKPRFCARNARKQGFRRPKKHKNLDFVLEKPENEGLESQKRTKTSILCSGKRELAPGREKISIRERKVAFLQITHRIPAPLAGSRLIQHPTPASRPGSSLIRRRYEGGVGNRCRWAERFASV